MHSFQFISRVLYNKILASFKIKIESDLSEVQVWLHKCPYAEAYQLQQAGLNSAAKNLAYAKGFFANSSLRFLPAALVNVFWCNE